MTPSELAGVNPTRDINVPILYVVCLLIYARVSRRYGLLVLGTVLALLTLLRLCFDYWPHLQDMWGPQLRYRLLNRSMVAMSLLTCAYILQRWRSFQVCWEQQRAPVGNDSLIGRVSSQTFMALKRTVVVMVAGILITVLVLTDFETPGQVNVPILFVIPLLMIGLICPWRVTLVVLIGLLLLSIGGFFWGPRSTVARCAFCKPHL